MRNLNTDEIYDQILLMNHESLLSYKRSISNIVFMGMGEPLMNYNNVLKAIEKLTTIFFFMAVGSQIAWCLMGKYLRKFATSDKFIKNFNYTMSFLLIVCVILFYV